MGLNDNTNSISQEIKTINELTKEKETQRELNARLERKLELIFNEKFMENGVTYVYEFYNVELRNKIIKDIGQNDFEYVRVNKMYDKVLNRVVKIFKQHEKYLDWNCNDLRKK